MLITDKTQKSSMILASLVNEHYGPTHNNNPEVAVIESKNNHGSRATNTKASKPGHPDPASFH